MKYPDAEKNRETGSYIAVIGMIFFIGSLLIINSIILMVVGILLGMAGISIYILNWEEENEDTDW